MLGTGLAFSPDPGRLFIALGVRAVGLSNITSPFSGAIVVIAAVGDEARAAMAGNSFDPGPTDRAAF
jgi:hypothetical protein